jgi:hypothetical protein
MGASITPAMAAQSRTLPEGEVFYAIDCQDSVGQMATVDVLTSVATLVGTNAPTPNTTCAGPAAWDVTTGNMYWTSWNGPDTLMLADIETGQSTEVGLFIDGSFTIGSDGIAIDDVGNAYLVDQGSETGDDGRTTGMKLYSLDLATGAATYIANIQGMTGIFPCVAAFAFNPADGGFYLNCDSGAVANKLMKLNVTDGTTTIVCTWTHDIWGLAFDSNGIAWVPDADGGLASYDVSLGGDCGEQLGASITLNGLGWYTGSNIIATLSTPPAPAPAPAPAPELPSTGMSAGQQTLIALLATVAFVLAGGFFAVKRAIRRKA